jgi:hypothetical protein
MCVAASPSRPLRFSFATFKSAFEVHFCIADFRFLRTHVLTAHPIPCSHLSLADMIQYYPSVIHVGSQLVRASKVLDIPVIITEQYPKALGKTGTGPASYASPHE